MIPLSFLARAWPALAFGFLLSFASSLGQTYFIALFGGLWRAELGLSHGAFGGLYTAATALSALTLLWLGKLADQRPAVSLGAATLAVLGATALFVSALSALWMLALALYFLRLSGQGMLGHITATAMARWFDRERGRAIGLSILGFTAGEACLPLLVASLLVAFSWQQVWFGAGAVLLIGAVPLALFLGTRIAKRSLAAPASPAPGAEATPVPVASWTRAQVLRDARFYALLPGLLAPPVIVTGVLFHQVHLIEQKGWSLLGFTALYPLYAATSTGLTLLFGWLVDRVGTPRLLPFYLLPLAVGLGLLSQTDSLGFGAAFMVLMGATIGATTVIFGTLWAELYGTGHLGAIRALVTALMVFGTALSPGLMGLLIDGGVALERQYLGMAFYTVACAGLFLLVQKDLLARRGPPSAPTPASPPATPPATPPGPSLDA